MAKARTIEVEITADNEDVLGKLSEVEDALKRIAELQDRIRATPTYVPYPVYVYPYVPPVNPWYQPYYGTITVTCGTGLSGGDQLSSGGGNYTSC